MINPSKKNEKSIVDSKVPLGDAPGLLAKRDVIKDNSWCPNPKPNVEFDHWCDLDNPKRILYKDILKAEAVLKGVIPKTPLVKSRYSKEFRLNLSYKFELFHRTGSFNERGALYALSMLNTEQKNVGVITASLGNWAMALSYHGHRLGISVMTVLPEDTRMNIIEKCKDCGAIVILYGKSFDESKRQAFVLLAGNGRTYISGYDHPHVIAGSGTIGTEIMEQLPQTEAVLVPVGGGSLIAGIAVAIKHIKPDVLIYGVEPDKSCCFFKAMENEKPYRTVIGKTVAESLAIPTAGFNAFYTAKSLIDKMVLVDDDWITRSVLHLVENEQFVAEGAGATSLSALLAIPDILPELRSKNVVCVITGGNIDSVTLPRCLERAKAVEGRIIKLTVTLPADDMKEQVKILSLIANVRANILQCYIERGWIMENNFYTIYLVLMIETFSLEHSCTVKRVLERFYPNKCYFHEEPFSPIPICSCFPRQFP